MRVPTVQISVNDESVTINEADFNPDKHQLFDPCPFVEDASVVPDDDHDAEPTSPSVRDEIESACDMDSLFAVAEREGLSLHHAIRKIDTARAKLLEQIEE